MYEIRREIECKTAAYTFLKDDKQWDKSTLGHSIGPDLSVVIDGNSNPNSTTYIALFSDNQKGVFS